MLRAMAAAFSAVRRSPRRLPRPVERLDQLQLWVILLGFGLLGGHVGVWAVLLAALTNAHAISPGRLGQFLATMSVAGAVSTFVGGRLSDRVGRRWLLVIALAGVGESFVAFAGATSQAFVLAIFLMMGLAGGCLDLSLNSLGGDYERLHGRPVMSGLHAGFSAGAALTALLTGVGLASGLSFQIIYAAYGVVLAIGACLMAFAPLLGRLPAPMGDADSRSRRARLLSRGLVVAMALVGLTFMQDAVIEGFAAVYLHDFLGAGALLLGSGIAGTHAAVLAGRLLSVFTIRRYGEQPVLIASGLGRPWGWRWS